MLHILDRLVDMGAEAQRCRAAKVMIQPQRVMTAADKLEQQPIAGVRA